MGWGWGVVSPERNVEFSDNVKSRGKNGKLFVGSFVNGGSKTNQLQRRNPDHVRKQISPMGPKKRHLSFYRPLHKSECISINGCFIWKNDTSANGFFVTAPLVQRSILQMLILRCKFIDFQLHISFWQLSGISFRPDSRSCTRAAAARISKLMQRRDIR